ncbi:MAG: hypothetical protein HY909_25740 [Deltaproteobacteria bacterium]|nr:hypothetical protein [Deltaproteobacteria bacterium]
MPTRHYTVATLLAALALPSLASAQPAWCVPGNPLYERGDYRCFDRPPRPSRARATVQARVEAARFLSGGSLSENTRSELEDWLNGIEAELARALPSLVDGHGALHTPDVRLALVLLPSGDVGRVRLLSRHGDTLDREIARSLVGAVSNADGTDTAGAELELIVRLHPRLHYTRWRRPAPRWDYDEE